MEIVVHGMFSSLRTRKQPVIKCGTRHGLTSAGRQTQKTGRNYEQWKRDNTNAFWLIVNEYGSLLVINTLCVDGT